MNGRYYVGEWLVEPEQNRLIRGSETAKLDPKAVQVLSCLAEHPNEILTKEQIFAVVWDGAFVSDEVLTTAIWGLRKALGDDAKEPRYIQTIPRRGYRLIAPVEKGASEASTRWEPSPYPGLSSFSQRDAQYFFGREREIESLWTKLQERTLLGLIGPSGAGKSSLLRAGLIPAAPEGWEVFFGKPRSDGFEGFRKEGGKTLWVVDQFEELFTLHDEETQGRIVELLGRASESGVHVLLSMRDDFLIRCHAFPALEPVFDKLTPVLPLEGAALRRALVEPARASGYRFEDEALVAEILTEISRERGALPLLAFAASKLWESRDRENRRLTREAYLAIGGVAGALAQHAEETLSEIGTERERLVREIFRNLTTASGTRLPMDREELLTVFPDRDEAARVLSKLIDARLLTSSEGEIEVIHESLLTAWPRLVRWQAEDAAGAVLRDQLRQAARAWEERGHSDDFLWTGAPFRDFSIWRERYSGGLSAKEEAFAVACLNLANRRRRRKRVAFAMILAASLAVAVVTSGLWRRSESETRRAEASKLLLLGQLEVERDPGGALAYALKSFELADTEEARRFVLPLLTNAPTSIRTPADERDGLEAITLAVSPSGEWVATGGYRGVVLHHRDGGDPIVLQGEYATEGLYPSEVGFSADSSLLVSNRRGDLRVWSVPGGREVFRVKLEEGPSRLFVRANRIFTSTTVGERQILRWSSFEKTESHFIGSMDALRVEGIYPGGGVDVSRDGAAVAYALGGRVYLRSLADWSRPPVLVAEHAETILGVAVHPDGSRLAASDASGDIRIWAATERSSRPLRVFEAAKTYDLLTFSPDGRWLATAGDVDTVWVVRLWDLEAPQGTSPLELRTIANAWNWFAFDARAQWLVTTHAFQLAFWPLQGSYPRVLDGTPAHDLAFTPDGTAVLSARSDLRVLPLDPENSSEPRVLLPSLASFPLIALDAKGGNVVAPSARGEILVASMYGIYGIDGSPPRTLEGFSEEVALSAVAVSPDGGLVAAAPFVSSPEQKAIKVWDVGSGAPPIDLPVPAAGEGQDGGILNLAFVGRDQLLASGFFGLLLFDVENGLTKTVLQPLVTCFVLSRSKRYGFAAMEGSLVRFALDDDTSTRIPYPDVAYDIALNPEETLLATAGLDGIVRILPVSGGEPHLLYGHNGVVRAVAFSPDGQWLASGGFDGTIRLWPVPDVRETPLHTRSQEDLLAILRSRTNLRPVPDENSPTGWKLEIGPFPGWVKLPEL